MSRKHEIDVLELLEGGREPAQETATAIAWELAVTVICVTISLALGIIQLL